MGIALFSFWTLSFNCFPRGESFFFILGLKNQLYGNGKNQIHQESITLYLEQILVQAPEIIFQESAKM